MSSNRKDWDTKDWERYVDKLLSIHHSLRGESYQPVPDYGGDRALEGFTDTGEAYQSYADQGSKNNSERTRKQKKKIKEDLEALEKYKEFWEDMLGDRKLHHWTLMVPELDDKEVVRYAKRKARQLAGKGLSFIADDFYADVKTHEQFPVAVSLLRTQRLPTIPTRDVRDEDIESYRAQHPDFIKRLACKLTKAMPRATNEHVQAQESQWLGWHLKSSNYLDSLLGKYPVLWEALDELIQTTEKTIETEAPFDTRAADQRLRQTRKDFEAMLATKEFEFLGTADRATVSFGAVAKWLGNCPLDFPGGCNG